MESESQYICKRCSRRSKEEGCWKNQDRWDSEGSCESIKCNVVKLTPVDREAPFEDYLPANIRAAVERDILIFGLAFVEKSTYKRMSNGEEKTLNQYIQYPVGSMTIGQIKDWEKRQGFTKYAKTNKSWIKQE